MPLSNCPALLRHKWTFEEAIYGLRVEAQNGLSHFGVYYQMRRASGRCCGASFEGEVAVEIVVVLLDRRVYIMVDVQMRGSSAPRVRRNLHLPTYRRYRPPSAIGRPGHCARGSTLPTLPSYATDTLLLPGPGTAPPPASSGHVLGWRPGQRLPLARLARPTRLARCGLQLIATVSDFVTKESEFVFNLQLELLLLHC